MADNLGYTPGSGANVATDDVGGVHFQKIKQADGADDSSVMQRVRTGTPGAADGGAVVRQAPCVIWTPDLSGSDAGALICSDFTECRKGTGVGVSQSNGRIVITTGTTAGAEYLARSVRSFKGSHIFKFNTFFSQRIANQNFYAMLADMVGEGLTCTINSATSISVTKTAHGFTAANVGQSMMVGAVNGASGIPGYYAIASIPDANTINFTVSGWPASGSCTVDLFGWNYLSYLFTGTNAQTHSIDSARNGRAIGAGALFINGISSSPGALLHIADEGRQVYWGNVGGNTSLANPVTSGQRYEGIPDDNTPLYVYFLAANGATAPASSTTWNLTSISVEETTNAPVYLAGIRPQGTNSPLPVALSSSVPAGTNAVGDVGVQYRANATGAASVANINSPATPAAQSVKASAGRLLQGVLVNHGTSTVFMKFFNTASPTLGTTNAVFEIALPVNIAVNINAEGGIAFSSAIVVAITGARGLADNTSITANTVTGFLAFA